MTGTIPAELGELSNLTLLLLHSNELSGAIPSDLGKLAKLEWLWLSNNKI